MKKIEILPAITTITKSEWRNKIKEIKKLGTKEAALFPTCLEKEEREEMYALVRESGIKSVPFVHIKPDMGEQELGYLVENFETSVFNIHSNKEYSHVYDYHTYRNKIYVENVYYPLDEEEIGSFSGICLDFSHIENDRLLYGEKYAMNIGVIEKFSVGCNHVSSIREETELDPESKYDKTSYRHDFHFLRDLSEIDYICNYPLKYFSSFVAIELENSIKEQLAVKKYMEKLIAKIK